MFSDVQLKVFFAPPGIGPLVSSVPVALNSGVEKCPDVVSQVRLALITFDRADLAWQVGDRVWVLDLGIAPARRDPASLGS